MAFLHVQGGAAFTGNTSLSTISVTLGANVGSGNNVMGFFEGGLGPSVHISTIKDDQNNSYTSVDTRLDGNNLVSGTSFFLLNITNAPKTITVTLTAGATFLNLVIDEFSGAIGGLAAHNINGQLGPGTGANAVTSGSVTNPSNGSLVYGGMGNQGISNATAVGTGFTAGQNSQPAGDDFCYSEYILSQASGSIAATFTLSANDNCMTAVMVFSVPSAGGSAEPPFTGVGVGVWI